MSKAQQTFLQEKEAITSFWVVRDATPKSSMQDVMFKANVDEFASYILGAGSKDSVKKENLKITLQDNILTIEGEKKKEEEKKDKNFYRCERIFGSFKRSFTLPAEVDSDKVEAKFEDGMLNITLKKIEPKVKNEKVIELK